MQRFPPSVAENWGKIDAFIGFAIGMIAGASLYLGLAQEPDPLLVMLGAILAWTVYLWTRTRTWRPVWLSLFVFIAGMAGGGLAGSLSTQRTQHVAVTAPIGPILVEGWVIAAEPATRGVRLRLKVHSVDSLDPAETPDMVRVTHLLSLTTEPGRFVRCWVVLRPPPQPIMAGDYDFGRQAWFSGLAAVGYVQGRCRGGALGPPQDLSARTALSIAQTRRQLARYVYAAAGERAGGFAAALASGDRSFMRVEDQEALRRSGLAHLLAISGLHMGIVGGLVFLTLWRGLALIETIALRMSVRKPAAIGALFACASYLVISGASVSTQRAFIMSAIIFGAVIWDRKALSMRSLALAMILVISIAPWSVLTPGFQMSFSATAALVATYEVWRKRRRSAPSGGTSGAIFWLKSLVVTSTVSSLATAPFALYHFDRFAGLGILANLIAMPIISLISAPLAGIALILAPIGMDAWALWAFGASLEWVLMIAHFMAGDAPSARQVHAHMPSISLIAFTAAIMVYAAPVSGRLKAVGIAALSGGAVLLWLGSARDHIHWAPSGDLFIVPAFKPVERWQVREGDGLSPLRLADLPVTGDCEEAAPCEIKAAGFDIRVLSDDPLNIPPNRIRVTEALADAGADRTFAAISWQEVRQYNGVTLERRNGRLIKRRKPPCGRRPWRPCPTE